MVQIDVRGTPGRSKEVPGSISGLKPRKNGPKILIFTPSPVVLDFRRQPCHQRRSHESRGGCHWRRMSKQPEGASRRSGTGQQRQARWVRPRSTHLPGPRSIPPKYLLEIVLDLVSGADFWCKLMPGGRPVDLRGSRGRFPG